jgi:hypothetical protein
MYWRCGSSERVTALPAQRLKFKPWTHKKQNKQNKNTQGINETKSWLFEKINKIDKSD